MFAVFRFLLENRQLIADLLKMFSEKSKEERRRVAELFGDTDSFGQLIRMILECFENASPDRKKRLVSHFVADDEVSQVVEGFNT